MRESRHHVDCLVGFGTPDMAAICRAALVCIAGVHQVTVIAVLNNTGYRNL